MAEPYGRKVSKPRLFSYPRFRNVPEHWEFGRGQQFARRFPMFVSVLGLFPQKRCHFELV
jgi:hypothetical protein